MESQQRRQVQAKLAHQSARDESLEGRDTQTRRREHQRRRGPGAKGGCGCRQPSLRGCLCEGEVISFPAQWDLENLHGVFSGSEDYGSATVGWNEEQSCRSPFTLCPTTAGCACTCLGRAGLEAGSACSTYSRARSLHHCRPRTSQTRGPHSLGIGARCGTGANVSHTCRTACSSLRAAAGAPAARTAKENVEIETITIYCKEYFSGVGGLTKAWAECQSLTSLRPLEAYGPGGYRPSHDLTKPSVLRIELDAIEGSAVMGAHLGTPCASFCRMFQNLGPGTRKAAQPEGDGSVAKEILGNTLCRATVRICEHLHSKGGLFSVESPRASWLFRQPSFLRLLRRRGVCMVHFDQCAYGVKPPDDVKGRIKKPTTIVANFPEVMKLARRCSCSRPHTVLQGSVRTPDGVFNRTALAAAYPPALCRALAGCYETAARRLHKNTSA